MPVTPDVCDLVTCDYCGALFAPVELAAYRAEIERLRTALEEIATADVSRCYMGGRHIDEENKHIAAAALTPTEQTP